MPAPAIVDSTSRAILAYPIGYDDEDDSAYELMVSLSRAPGNIIEYSFCILCIHQNGVVHDFWDSKVVANMISSADRQLIRAVLLDATASLVQGTNFPEVTMHTFALDLPAKALVKYRLIAQIFTNEGYNVRQTVRHGQYIWWFDRGERPKKIKKRRRTRRRRQ